MNNQLEQNVKRGVELLDKEVPGWRDKIDIDKIFIQSLRYCVLGQVFGSFTEGRKKLNLLDENPLFEHGFDIKQSYLDKGEYTFENLQNEWLRELKNDKTTN